MNMRAILLALLLAVQPVLAAHVNWGPVVAHAVEEGESVNLVGAVLVTLLRVDGPKEGDHKRSAITLIGEPVEGGLRLDEAHVSVELWSKRKGVESVDQWLFICAPDGALREAFHGLLTRPIGSSGFEREELALPGEAEVLAKLGSVLDRLAK